MGDYEYQFARREPGAADYQTELRIYVSCEQLPNVADLSAAIGSPLIRPPRHGDPYEMVFVRKRAYRSENEFREECGVLLKLLWHLVPGPASIMFLYDSARAESRYFLSLRRTDEYSRFRSLYGQPRRRLTVDEEDSPTREEWDRPAAQRAHETQFRIYIECDDLPHVAGFATILDIPRAVRASCSAIPPWQFAIARRIALNSEAEFRKECDRITATIAPFVKGCASIAFLYDDSRGETIYLLRLKRLDDFSEFSEDSEPSSL